MRQPATRSALLAALLLLGVGCGSSSPASPGADGGAAGSDGGGVAADGGAAGSDGGAACATCTVHVTATPPENINAFDVDDTAVYYARNAGTATAGSHLLLKQPFAGGAPTTLATATFIRDVRIDATSAYYFASNNTSAYELRRVSTAGAGDAQLANGIVDGTMLAVATDDVFLGSRPTSTSLAIGRVSKTAATPAAPTVICSSETAGDPSSVTATSGAVFFTVPDHAALWRCALPGPATPDQLALGAAGQVRALAQVGSDIYFVVSGSDSFLSIKKVASNAMTAAGATTLVDHRNNITGFAATSTNLYWLEQTSGAGEQPAYTVFRADLSGGGVTALAATPCGCGLFRTNSTRLFWHEVNLGVWRVVSVPR